MGIVNTQYIVCRHTDTAHLHLHIVANRVDNDGDTISDSNDSRRSARICRELTQEYGLHIANGKDKVRRDRLRGKDRVKYRIYDVVKAALATCLSWSELDKTLTSESVQIRFRYDTQRGRIIGISFTADGCTFSGSKIDRTMSFYALDRQFGGRMLEAGEQRLPADSELYKHRLAELERSGRAVAPVFGESKAETDMQYPNATYTEGGNATNVGEIAADIIQITVATFIELAVQPHQVRISSGGGGSDKSGWNDKDKNEYKPRRRR